MLAPPVTEAVLIWSCDSTVITQLCRTVRSSHHQAFIVPFFKFSFFLKKKIIRGFSQSRTKAAGCWKIPSSLSGVVSREVFLRRGQNKRSLERIDYIDCNSSRSSQTWAGIRTAGTLHQTHVPVLTPNLGHYIWDRAQGPHGVPGREGATLWGPPN